MDAATQVILKEKCYLSLNAGIKRLCEIETWPRPRAARRLRVGHDFYRNQMEGIPEVDDFIEQLSSEAEIRSNYFMNPNEPENWRLYGFWELLLLRCLPETDGTILRKEVFRKWFDIFIRELFESQATWRTIQYISGLTLNVNQFRLDECTVLMRCPRFGFLQRLWGRQVFIEEGRFEPEGLGATGGDKAIVVITVRLPKKDFSFSNRPPPHLTKDLERSAALIDAIRLTETGTPRLHCYAQVHLSRFPLDEPLAFTHENGITTLYETEAVINRKSIPQIKRVWKNLMDTKYAEPWPSLNKPTKLDVALSGLSRSYELRSWLDNIVDLTIALESLFGPRDDRELSHRISIRAAWLLSSFLRKSEGKLENKIYKLVRTMYEIRSNRVHGDIPSDSNIRKWIQILSGVEYETYDKAAERKLLTQSLESSRTIVRTAIRACMELQKLTGKDGPQWPLPRDFDQNILIPGQQRVWQKAAKVTPLS